jgi:hypothetical protein
MKPPKMERKTRASTTKEDKARHMKLLMGSDPKSMALNMCIETAIDERDRERVKQQLNQPLISKHRMFEEYKSKLT